MMKLMYITNSLKLAKIADNAGIDRIFIDLELLGKKERQGHLNTHITNHTIEDISKVRKVINNSDLLVRVNPIHDKSKEEIDSVISKGADIVMLPMFKTKDEVQQFIKYVNGRAKVSLLLETSQAFIRVNDILDLPGIDEVHIGLNDLHISFGLDFMFELLSEGIIDYLANIIHKRGIRFGFGGIAKLGEGVIPSELIIKEHYRLNSDTVILSREFRNLKGNIEEALKSEVEKIRSAERETQMLDKIELECNRIHVQSLIRNYVENRRENVYV